MTRKRAIEIERKVIYRNVGFFAALNLSTEKMFEVGRLFDRLHQDLKRELDKERIRWKVQRDGRCK